MSAEPIERIIKLWETERITQIQVIGKILVWLLHVYTENSRLHIKVAKMETRLAQLEAKLTNGELPTNPEGTF